MAMLYVKDETRKQIELIASNQHRDMSDEIDLLVKRRFKELNIHADNADSLREIKNIPQPTVISQA
jgi:hypothetical protein